MASELRVNTLKDAAGSNEVAMTYVAGGSAKAWVNFDGTAASIAARDSFNITSITDNGTGQYTANFSNSMTNDDFVHNITVRLTTGSGAAFGSIREASYSTNAMGIYVFQADTTLADAVYVVSSLHGDLA